MATTSEDDIVEPLRFGVPANANTWLDVSDLVAAQSRWLVALGEVIAYPDDAACPHRSDVGELVAALEHELHNGLRFVA